MLLFCYCKLRAFYNCTDITSVTIPNSVTSIGSSAFSGCSGLTEVYYNTEEPIKASENIFDSSTYSNATLYAPEVGVEVCKYTSPWSNFSKIEAYEILGIEEISADFSEQPYEVYNLNGVMVGDNIDTLAPGIYIVRQGATTKKIAVR